MCDAAVMIVMCPPSGSEEKSIEVCAEECITTECEGHNAPVQQTKPGAQSLLLQMRRRLTGLLDSLPGYL
jgi:hypothetical protein